MHQSSAQLLSQAVDGRLVLAITDYETHIEAIADAIEGGRLREVEVTRGGRALFRTLPAARPERRSIIGYGGITIRPGVDLDAPMPEDDAERHTLEEWDELHR